MSYFGYFSISFEKLCSVLRFWLEKLNYGFFFTQFSLEKIPQNKFSRQNFCVENDLFLYHIEKLVERNK